jgi:magnesium-transporting ATPase (P-type)
MVKIKKDEPIPADLIAFNSSADEGIVFIETKSLDGETNLK